MALLLSVLISCGFADAQDNAARAITIDQAVEMALANYPAVRTALAQKQAADAGIELSRTGFLPKAELLWQENRASRNNVFGLLLPQSVIPSISGPVLGTAGFENAWGSAGGLLFSWEPFDFGLRRTSIEAARAVSRQAQASVEVTKLDVAGAAADAFLAAILAAQTAHAARINVERFASLANTVRALVDNQLRPGVDLSRADAELAAARNQLIRAEESLELARISLAEAIGEGGTQVLPEVGPLLQLPLPATLAASDFNMHPLALVQKAALESVRARQQVLERSNYPHFNFQTSLFGRGTGALTDGRINNARGFYPDTANWAAGVTVTFGISNIFAIRARRKVEAANAAAEEARYDQVIQNLKTQQARTRTMSEAARRLAENTPLQLQAARETLERSKVRYEYGLTNITEVSEAQHLLAEAEIADAVAHLAAWRAQLTGARMQGDLKPFLELVARTPVKGKE